MSDFSTQQKMMNNALLLNGSSNKNLSKITGISERHIISLKYGRKEWSYHTKLMIERIVSGEIINAELQYIENKEVQKIIMQEALAKAGSNEALCEKIMLTKDYVRKLSKGDKKWSFQLQIDIQKYILS